MFSLDFYSFWKMKSLFYCFFYKMFDLFYNILDSFLSLCYMAFVQIFALFQSSYSLAAQILFCLSFLNSSFLSLISQVMRSLYCLLIFSFYLGKMYFSELLQMLISDLGHFFDLLLLDFDFVQISSFVQLQNFYSVFYYVDVSLCFEQIFYSSE